MALMGGRMRQQWRVHRCGTGACFHANAAWWHIDKELSDLIATQHTFFHLFAMIIETYNVKNIFC